MEKLMFLFVLVSVSIFHLSSCSDIPADYVRSPVDLDNTNVVKREAQSSAGSSPKANVPNNYTSVKTSQGCKLYSLDVIFFKKVAASEQGQYETSEVHVPGTSLENAHEGSCGNWSGNIILNYKGPFTASGKGGSLTSLKLTFNITSLRAFGWWELTQLGVDATGDMVKDGFSTVFNGTVMKSMAIGASKKFSYACGQPPTLYYSVDKYQKTVFGLKFKNLQIQPFEWSRRPGNFTNNVDDCVPFFSIGVWMFLVVASVLLLIVFFGIGMISSLKTMDRFDDPKGKPLVISAKE